MRGRKFVLIERPATRCDAALMAQAIPGSEAALDSLVIQGSTDTILDRGVSVLGSVCSAGPWMQMAIPAGMVDPSLLRVNNAILSIHDQMCKGRRCAQHQGHGNAGKDEHSSRYHQRPHTRRMSRAEQDLDKSGVTEARTRLLQSALRQKSGQCPDGQCASGYVAHFLIRTKLLKTSAHRFESGQLAMTKDRSLAERSMPRRSFCAS
jgi:hypothetical protein